MVVILLALLLALAAGFTAGYGVAAIRWEHKLAEVRARQNEYARILREYVIDALKDPR